MAIYHEIIVFTAVIFLFLHENALCNKGMLVFGYVLKFSKVVRRCIRNTDKVSC